MHRNKIAVAGRALLSAIMLLAAGCATTAGAPVTDISRPEDARYEDPTARTLYAMARVLESQGKQNQAETVLVRLLKEYPKFVPPYSDLAAMRTRQGRLEEALALLEAGSKISPGDPVLLNNTGVCLLMRGDAEAALKCFENAAARGGQTAKYRANKALALGILRRDAESKELYEAVVPESDTLHNLDIIRALRGDEPAQKNTAAEEAASIAAQQEADRLAAEEAARVAAAQEADRLAAEEAARIAAQQEADRLAAEEAARVAAAQEAERLAAEEAAHVAAAQEAARLAAEEAARVAAAQEAERLAAEEAAHVAAAQEAARLAAEEAARVAAAQEAERLAAEEAARIAAQQEAERLAAEEAAQEEAARLAARQVAQELAAKAESDPDAAPLDPAGVDKQPAPQPPAQPAATAAPPENAQATPNMAVVDAQPLG